MGPRGRGRPRTGATDVIPTEQLLDAALDAFAERGYEGTSVRELARDLGVSHNLIPQRIGTKDELWRAAVDHGFGQLAVALVARRRRRRRTTDLERLRALVVRFIEANAARPALLRIIAREAVAPGPRFDHLLEQLHRPGARCSAPTCSAGSRPPGEVRTELGGARLLLHDPRRRRPAGAARRWPSGSARRSTATTPTPCTAHAVAAADLLFDGPRPPARRRLLTTVTEACAAVPAVDIRRKLRERHRGRRRPARRAGDLRRAGRRPRPGRRARAACRGRSTATSPACRSPASAAIIMEVLHPSVMAGVYEQSSYRTQPLRRAQNTLGYVLRTTFGNTEAATDVIERVKRVHARIDGTRPDGVAYRALDPELIAWVHTCIPWAVMDGVRPLPPAAVDRGEGPLPRRAGGDRAHGRRRVGARVGGRARRVRRADAPAHGDDRADPRVHRLPRRRHRGRVPRDRRASSSSAGSASPASMTLMPTWARHLTGTYLPAPVRRLYLEPNARLQAALVRWAYPELPCARMALARADAAADLAAA